MDQLCHKNTGGSHLSRIFLGAWKSVRLKHYPAYPVIIISLIIQRNLATKIQAKWESSLTAVWLKRDPPVVLTRVAAQTHMATRHVNQEIQPAFLQFTPAQINGFINTSSKLLTKAQEIHLAYGPNFAMVLRSPPVTEYVAVIEQACSKLQQGEAEELRGEVKTIIKKAHNSPPNITKEERKAITELKKDPTRMILTADKGVSLVVMDTEEYNKKAEELLQQPTYKPIPTDPTSIYKNKFINMLKSIKAEGGISEAIYKRLYPTGAGSPTFYGLPKIHKEGMPLRPIVSSIGAVIYATFKELSRILKPLVGRSPYHAQHTQDFIQQIESIQLQPDQCMVSFDVKALSTSVSIQPTINIIKKLLEEDQSLQQRTTMSVNNITCLLEFC